MKFIEIFNYGDLIKNLLSRDFKTRYKRSYLGILWSLLNPFLIIIVYTLAFDYILGSFKRGEEIEVRFLQRLSLPEGIYYILVAIADAEETKFYDLQENVKSFEIKGNICHWEGIVNLNTKILIT